MPLSRALEQACPRKRGHGTRQFTWIETLEEKRTYMHRNPVRAGLVETAVAWRGSPARWYEQGRPVGVPIEGVDCQAAPLVAARPRRRGVWATRGRR